MPSTAAQAPDQDPFLLDAEQIQALAEPRLVSDALTLCREQRVTDLDSDGLGLWARVEDAETQEQLDLALAYDADGNLQTQCHCDGGRPGPALRPRPGGPVRLRARRSGARGELLGAVEGAIDERVKRGRTEVQVEPLSGGAHWPSGTWSARSINSRPGTSRPATGSRSAPSTRRANYCTCPDFATNQLGTCKHIEAVLHQLAQAHGTSRTDQGPAPADRPSSSWTGSASPAPQIRLHRAAGSDGGHWPGCWTSTSTPPGPSGGRLPEDFLRLADALAGRSDIDLGEDALGYARRLAEDAAQRLRAREIGERIRASRRAPAGGQRPALPLSGGGRRLPGRPTVAPCWRTTWAWARRSRPSPPRLLAAPPRRRWSASW